MTKPIGRVEVKKVRGNFEVIGMGRTGKGVKYIVEKEVLKATKITDKDFKAQQAAAVAKLFDTEE